MATLCPEKSFEDATDSGVHKCVRKQEVLSCLLALSVCDFGFVLASCFSGSHWFHWTPLFQGQWEMQGV